MLAAHKPSHQFWFEQGQHESAPGLAWRQTPAAWPLQQSLNQSPAAVQHVVSRPRWHWHPTATSMPSPLSASTGSSSTPPNHASATEQPQPTPTRTRSDPSSSRASRRQLPSGPPSARIALGKQSLAQQRRAAYLQRVRDGGGEGARWAAREAELASLDRKAWADEVRAWEEGMRGSAPALFDEDEDEEEEDVAEQIPQQQQGPVMWDAAGEQREGKGHEWEREYERDSLDDDALVEDALRLEMAELEALVGLLPSADAKASAQDQHMQQNTHEGVEGPSAAHAQHQHHKAGAESRVLLQEGQVGLRKRASSHFGSDDEEMDELFREMILDEMELDS